MIKGTREIPEIQDHKDPKDYREYQGLRAIKGTEGSADYPGYQVPQGLRVPRDLTATPGHRVLKDRPEYWPSM